MDLKPDNHRLTGLADPKMFSRTPPMPIAPLLIHFGLGGFGGEMEA